MNKFISLFLKNYDDNNQELLLKAQFLLSLTIIVILCLCGTLAYTSFTFGIMSATVVIQSVGLLIMLIALFLLLKGRYAFAVHIIFTTSFTVAWILMFFEPVSSILIKLDTIVFIIGLMSALPLMFFTTRKPIVIYFVLNLGVFVCFNYYLTTAANLSVREHVDYAFDNTIAMVFVFAVSYILFTIYSKILSSLKQFRLFLSSIIDSMPSIIIGIDTDFKINMWNKETAKVWGLSKRQVTNKFIFEILPQLEKFKQSIINTMETNITSKHHKIELSCQKRELIVEIAIYPLSHEESGGAVIRIDDISDRLQMEELIVQSEKMLSVGGLAAGMAHELNNPLAGMIQSAQVITNRLTQNIPANDKAANDVGSNMEDIKEFMEKRGVLNQLDNISKAGKRAAQIVNNMLSFARKSDSLKEETNINELVENALELAENDYDLSTKNDFKNITIIRKYDPKFSTIAKCEKSKIHQVVFNILKNASEALTAGKKNSSNSRIIINLFEDPEFVCLEIEDNGPGMDEKTRKRIFEPFFTTKPVGKGTGLGLSVSYFIIVEDHEGKMEVESTIGRGTKFTICLPKTEKIVS